MAQILADGDRPGAPGGPTCPLRVDAADRYRAGMVAPEVPPTEPDDPAEAGPEPIRGEVFRDEDWYGEQMVVRGFAECAFDDVDLTEAVTQGCVFTECTFTRVRFNASRHTDTAFLRCTFRRSNLFEAEFTGCKLIGST